MLGYKSITELSLEECCLFLQQKTNDERQDWVNARYVELSQQTARQEEEHFGKCKTVDDFDDFIKRYSQKSPYYHAKYLQKAQNEKNRLLEEARIREQQQKEWERQNALARQRRRKRGIIIFVASLVIVAAVVFMIGYKPVKSLSVEDASFAREGGTKELRVSTNVAPSAVRVDKPSADWVTVDYSGKTIRVTAVANPAPERSCKMEVKAYSTFFGGVVGNPKRQTVVIRQGSGYATNLIVSKSSFSVGKYGETQEVNIKTDGVKLSLSSNADWIRWTCYDENHDATNYHDDNYRIVVEKNPAGNRTGKILVETGGQSKEITITQASGLATNLRVDRTIIGTVDRSGTESGTCYRVMVTTDGTSWNVSTSYSWLDVTQYDNNFEIVVRSNPDEVRTGYVYVYSNNGHSETITVNQDGKPSSFSATRSSLTFDTGSDYTYVSLSNNSSMSVNATTDKSWLSAQVLGGDVKVSCTSNSNSPRDGIVTLKCGDRTSSIKVHQYGYKHDPCPNCDRDMWGNPTGVVYVGYFPYGHYETCYRCGGSRYIKTKAY